MENSFESITGQISTEETGQLSKELLRSEINGWNGFVDIMHEANERHVEDEELALEELQSELLVASRDKDVMIGKVRLYTVDIYMNGFKVVTRDEQGRSTLGIKMPAAPATFERVSEAECVVGRFRTPVNNHVMFEELGLQIIDIYSHDKTNFGGFNQIFVPAKNLVKR